MSTNAAGPRVGITYHFFPHYRSGIIRRLLASHKVRYLFVSDQQYSDGAIPPYRFAPGDNYRRARCRRLGPFYWQPGFIRLAMRRDIDAIISLGNPYFLSTWVMAVIARLTGKKTYLWTHGWTHREAALQRLFRHTYYRLFEHLFLYGTRAFDYGLSQGFAASDMTVVYNCLDYPAQRAFRESVSPQQVAQVRNDITAEPDAGAKQQVICFIGRLTENCRLDLLFEAIRLIDPSHQRFSVLIIGDGPARPALESSATDNGLSVRFTGAIYEEEKTALYLMASDVLVSPGKVGLTAMHAMAYGLPVITNGVWDGQMPEYESVVPGVTGEYFEQMTGASLGAAIERWLGHPATRSEVAAACIAEIEKRWNPDNQFALIESRMIQDLLSQAESQADSGQAQD